MSSTPSKPSTDNFTLWQPIVANDAKDDPTTDTFYIAFKADKKIYAVCVTTEKGDLDNGTIYDALRAALGYMARVRQLDISEVLGVSSATAEDKLPANTKVN
jgi:hypothetical protein